VSRPSQADLEVLDALVSAGCITREAAHQAATTAVAGFPVAYLREHGLVDKHPGAALICERLALAEDRTVRGFSCDCGTYWPVETVGEMELRTATTCARCRVGLAEEIRAEQKRRGPWDGERWLALASELIDDDARLHPTGTHLDCTELHDVCPYSRTSQTPETD
jgi:hypothetical protein